MMIQHKFYTAIYVQNFIISLNWFTKSSIARKPCQQFLHRYEQQSEVIQTPEEPPKVVAQQLSSLTFHLNPLC